jgi:hypothetical protein
VTGTPPSLASNRDRVRWLITDSRNLQEDTKETLRDPWGKENAFAFGYVVAGCAAEKRCTG